MLEPLSLTDSADMPSGFADLGNYARLSSGVSPESALLRRSANAVNRRARTSESLFGWKTKALEQLWAVVAESANTGSDGTDAAGIDPRALEMAETIIEVWPRGIPLPEFAAEPDGAISLDWIRSRHRIFSVSVGATNRLACAWIDGARRGHVIEPFDGSTLPEFIGSAVRAIMK